YLEKGILPEDPVDARTLMEKIRNYTMEDGVLYRKSYLVPLMRPRQVVAKAMNLGYYWPSMHRDARELIRACDDGQTHASVPRLPKADMILVTSAWSFMKWGIDIVGPLPEGSGRVKYLIVATDYFTKWIEAKPLAFITGKQVVNFTCDNIVCGFGIPATIITDNGTQFTNDPFKKWVEKLKIQLISTSFYHPVCRKRISHKGQKTKPRTTKLSTEWKCVKRRSKIKAKESIKLDSQPRQSQSQLRETEAENTI
ncbi:reverse transcriptase domain-containing protein, partial [Tanacetum coccineum]